jgi:hypothetical protein
MERALRKADDDSSGLDELLLSLVQDSTTLGMLKPGVKSGVRGGSFELPLDVWWRSGEAAAMLSGESSAASSSEDVVPIAGGDCKPPCDRGRSRSNSPLRTCWACESGGGWLHSLGRNRARALCSWAAACFDNVSG